MQSNERCYCVKCKRKTLSHEEIKLLNRLPNVLMFWNNIDYSASNATNCNESDWNSDEMKDIELFLNEIDFSQATWKMVINKDLAAENAIM